MNKNFWFFTAVNALFVSAFTVVLTQSGIMAAPSLIFPLLSLIIPLAVRRVRTFPFNADLPVNMWYHVYSWMFWTLFGFLHTPFSIRSDSVLAGLFYSFAVYFVIQVLIELVALLFTLNYRTPGERPAWREAVDMALYVLPIPFLYLGSILFIDLGDPLLRYMYANSINTNILLVEFVLLLLAMLVFVFYLYPRNARYKPARLLRIVVTAFVWLAMNGHILYGGYMPEFVKAAAPAVLPVYQGNILVFITPTLIEFVFIIVSVYVGKFAEDIIIKRAAHSRRR